MAGRSWNNWAGNQTANPRRIVTPASVEEVAAAVHAAADAGLAVKAVGSGHSFTPVAVADGVQLRLDRLAGVRSLDRATGLVTVDAGMPLHRLCEVLAAAGLGLTNMGDIAAQTVAGAISTGTHGTGRESGALATQVCGLELVLADGSVIRCSAEERPEVFAAARVGLGALGVITAVTLQAEPAFLLHAREEPMPVEEVLSGFDDFAAANEHFEFYWFPHTAGALVKRNNRAAGPPAPLSGPRAWLDDEFLSNTVYGLTCRAGRAAPRLIRPINQIACRALSAREYTDASYKVFTSPRRVRFVEMEYAVPRDAVVSVVRDLRSLIDRSDWHISFPVEVRIVPADDLWLSTAHGRDSGYIAVHMFVGSRYEDYFAGVEALMVGHGGRPHWGKLHTRDAEYLAESYPRFGDFVALRDKLDPDRRFANAHLHRVLGA